jgi:hypothetical protein
MSRILPTFIRSNDRRTAAPIRERARVGSGVKSRSRCEYVRVTFPPDTER